MRLAYVITAHRGPTQFLRLLRAIHAPQNTYVLHVDSKATPGVHDAARSFASEHRNCFVISSENIIWGSWRLAHAQIRGMAEALHRSKDWTYCLNLTAQDYPLKTQAQIAAALDAGPRAANYLEVLKFAKAGPNPRKRLEYYWIPWRGKLIKALHRPQPKFEVFWGSNYFVLTRDACEHLARSEISQRMQKTFRFTQCADELIFQNAIMHSPLRETIVSKTFRKLTWDGGSHPKTYTITDRDELISSDAWFARKFDVGVDFRVLDALDEHLGQG